MLSFGVVCKMELECAIMPPGIFDEEDKKVHIHKCDVIDVGAKPNFHAVFAVKVWKTS